MRRYSGYPTPPSTSGESPVSDNSTSSPSYTFENSGSPVSQLMYLQNNATEPVLDIVSEQGFTSIHLAKNSPYLKIVEQPLDKFRFRYKSEMTGTHGSLSGENSDKSRKMTYPTAELCNYDGEAVIRCSIWQINHEGDTSSPHAHRLVKKKNHKTECDDPHEEVVNKETGHLAAFHSMGIIHTAKKNLVSELIKKKTKLKQEEIDRGGKRLMNKKEEMEIKGLAEAESKSINLNVVCLRFDAFFVSHGIYWPLCPPVFSNAISNLKSALTGELKIVRMDHCTSPAIGGREIFLFVERVTKKNIKVRFYELDDYDNVVWEDYGRFNELDVHHQYAIALRTPPYRNRNITSNVNVFMELVRSTDKETSEPRTFKYIPMPEHWRVGAKRARPNDFDVNDYDTPLSINGMHPLTIPSSSSEFDIEELAKDMDSNEIEELYKKYRDEYDQTLPNLENVNISVDCPANLHAMRQNCLEKNTKIKMYESKEKNMKRIFEELTEFIKNKPKKDEIKNMLQHHLNQVSNTEDRLNAFHIAVRTHNVKMINFFVSLMTFTESYDLFNVTSSYGTVLHLAIMSMNVDLVRVLISKCKVDISKKDDNDNTPLHIAAKEDKGGAMLDTLLHMNNINEIINWSNKDGDTALHLAVKRNNPIGVRLLCQYGADADFRHPSNGYTALRFAVENEDSAMVHVLLNEVKVNPKVRDFLEIDPLQAVIHYRTTLKLKEVVQTYMAENNISCDEIRVKEEIDDESSDEDFAMNAETPLSAEDVQKLYSNTTQFKGSRLNELCALLDDSGKWQELAALFDVEHLFRMDIFHENKSPSRQLLNFVISSNTGSMQEIRDFLESLDQVEAVQVMDKMVYEIHNEKL